MRKIVNFSQILLKRFQLIRQIVLGLVLCGSSLAGLAQQSTPETQRPDTLKLPADTISSKSDTTTRATPRSDIRTTILYSARDSIRASLDNKRIWLYGNASITYGEIKLDADEILIDYEAGTLTAHGSRDSTGRRIGFPVFQNGNEKYETKDIVYNFKTRKARISEVVTTQGDGILHGAIAYKNERNEVLSIGNDYTTCNLEKPHFYIRATKTKAIPKDKIVAGPFYIVFNEIPLPIGFLFGMFPAQRESQSGIIVPSYGEESRRGFNLRRGGYYFHINEYMNLAITGDIYSKGGNALNISSSYLKRYKYTGNLQFSYSHNPVIDNKIETNDFTNDFRIQWTHSPQSKGTGRFSASVNAATSTFTANNNLMLGTPGDLATRGLNNLDTKINSSISYSKRFKGTPFSMGLNLRHFQDLATKVVDLPLPDISVNMVNIYPFKSKSGSGALDNFSIAYTMNASNRITNNLGRLDPTSTRDSIAPFNLNNLPTFIENGRRGMRHSVPVQFNFKVLKYLTATPNVTIDEKWYGEKYSWAYRASDSLLVRSDTVKGFTRVSNMRASFSFATRFYGMYTFKNKNKKLRAIRHVIAPSFGLSYTPDYSKNREYFDKIVNPKTGVTEYKSRNEGSLYGGSDLGRSGSLNFGIGNNLEAKFQGPEDSVARKVMLLNNFSLNAGYNMVADSFKLSTVSIAANTNILDNLINLNFSANLDPYNYVSTTDEAGKTTERRVNALAWKSRGLGRITTATLGFTTNLNPSARKNQAKSQQKIAQSNLPQQEKDFLLNDPNAYVDFEIPWSMNINYSMAYTRPLNTKGKFVPSLQLSGDVSLSEKWKITYATGYSFTQKEFTLTNIGLSRDLHCWTMRFNWVPFGRFQSYNFTIAVKSSLLQDLKLERRRSFFDSN